MEDDLSKPQITVLAQIDFSGIKTIAELCHQAEAAFEQLKEDKCPVSIKVADLRGYFFRGGILSFVVLCNFQSV